MSKLVQVPQSLLAAVGAALVLCLLALGFLLGRQGGPPVSQETPSAQPTSANGGPPLAVNQPKEEPSLDTRLDAIEKRVQTVRQKELVQGVAGSPSPTIAPVAVDRPAKPPSAQAQATGVYLRQIDAIVGSSAVGPGSPPFATRLLEQSMSGDSTESAALITRTSQAKSDLEAVDPPDHCREHHSLLLAQIADALALLKEVQIATQTGDTAKLAALAAGGERRQEEALRLQEIDRKLRSQLEPR